MEHLIAWLNEKRGRRGELAAALNITSGAISQWTQVPPERAVAVERITGIPRNRLCPEMAAIFAPSRQEEGV
jgi:DNA-binding transcriptional regulator YdaS (Cro superfamily)